MQCPIDQTDLRPTDRQGIEIDWCPTCRGVWLDRGELDKLIERSGTFAERGRDVEVEEVEWDERDRDERGRTPGRRKRRGSFLDDLFDF